MLESMRRGSKNIFVKVALGALALSFVSWGINDMFRGGGSNNEVAKVGDTPISITQYNNSLQREMGRYQQILGRALTDEEVEQFNIKSNVLTRLVDEVLINLSIADLNLRVGDDVIKKQLLENEVFHDESGKFSQDNFRSVLRANGFSEERYIESIRNSAAIRLLVDTMDIKPLSMQKQAQILHNYRNEKRIVDFLVMPVNYIKDVGEPTDAELIQYYQDNESRFLVPQFRKVTYLTFNIDNMQDDLAISDDALRAEYENNIDIYTEEEMRDIDQYLFESEEEAKNALELLEKGEGSSFADKKVSLGKVAKVDLPEEIQEIAFAAKANEFSEPVSTVLGWHVLYVNDIESKRVLEFEEVKEDIKAQFVDTKSSEIFYEFANQIEDSLAGGMTLEDLAKQYDLLIHKVAAIDNMGRGQTGKVLAQIPDLKNFTSLVFDLDEAVESPLTLSEDNSTYLIARVDSITEQRVKALDEVRGMVTDLWAKQERAKELQNQARQVAKRLKGDERIDLVCKTDGT